MFAKNREVKPSEKAVQFVIKKQEDIKRMMNNKESVGAIVIDEDVCNDMKEDLVIEHFENLRSILVRKKSMKILARCCLPILGSADRCFYRPAVTWRRSFARSL